MSNKKKLALFFTEGVSLKTWQEVGMLDREIKPYNHLAEFFEKIYFITYGDKNDLKFSNLLKDNIVILPKKINLPSKLYSFLVPIVYRRELKEADIYKTNQMQAAWTALLAKFLFKKKLVVRCGYQWSQFATSWKMGKIKQFVVAVIEKLAYSFADEIILTTDQAKNYIVKRYSVPADKIRVISNYIDTELFKPANSLKEKGSIIYIGRLEKEKNLMALLEALNGLDLKLTIIGNGILRKELEDHAVMNGIEVNFMGNVPNEKLPAELTKHEMFILPSLYEGNPKVLLEAMSCGLPVIGTNVRGIGNIIKHKENGYLCEIDSGSIRNALVETSADEVLRQKMGAEARKYILNNCSLDIVIKKEKSVYAELIN